MSLIRQEVFDEFPEEAKKFFKERYSEYLEQLHNSHDRDMRLATAAVIGEYMVLFGSENLKNNVPET